MISSKMLTASLIYKVKKTNHPVDTTCYNIEQEVMNIFKSDKFNEYMYIITKECYLTTEYNDKQIEIIVTMFVTYDSDNVDNPLMQLKKFINENMINIDTDTFSVHLIKRRVY